VELPARDGLYFVPLPVFALEQTDGDPLPSVELPPVDSPEVFARSAETLRDLASERLGSVVARIEIRPRRRGDPDQAHGWYVRGTKEIVVIDGERSRAHVFKMLVHELAHAILHGDGDHHDKPTKEVEAESTAYVVCHALGLDTSAFSLPYVTAWAGGGDATATILASGARITGAVNGILDALLPREPTEATRAA
jgi:hypothetical protein